MRPRMRRRGGAIAAALVLIAHHLAAADRPVHEVQVLAGKFAFEPTTIQVTKGGDPVTVEFTAPAVGQYEIACSEFCGSGHGHMKAALISVAPVTTNR